MATTDSKTGPFFCKLIIGDDYDDSASIFQIPYHFVKSYGDVLPSYAKLKYGESGKHWRVAIEKFRGHYFFTHGWKKFAEDADIKSLEYISFKLVGLSDPKKDLNSGGDRVKRAKKLNSPVLDVVKVLNFVKKFKAHHKNRMSIPVKFAIDTGIAEDRKMLLQDEQGRKWQVRVTDKNIGSYSMSKGWTDFVRGNNVVSGNMLSFEFLGSNIVKTQVIKEGTNNENELLGSVKKKAFPSDTEQENDYVYERIWIFSKELKKHPFSHKLAIPEDFAVGTGLVREREIKLVDEKGKEWNVRVVEGQCGQFAMTDGWSEFLVGNNVVTGSTISFEFVSASSDYIIETRVKKGIREGPQSSS